ncbi:Pre-mRNA-splicing factor cwc26 [Malassezia sp. CBS 17886]|nr:Pre-mRNA-splicing factor cwc26 [Malassezia sp. CBS 17886]
MPDPSVQRYLAEKYYSGAKSDAILSRYGGDGDSARKKKKKKPRAGGVPSGDALTVRDESTVWFGDQAEEAEEGDEGEAGGNKEGAVTVDVVHAHMPSTDARTGTSGWSSVRTAEAAAPAEAAPPAVPDAATEPPVTDPGMSGVAPSAPKVGLMSRAQLRAQREAQEADAAEARAREEAEAAESGAGDAQATVYRDVHGRRIDIEEEDARVRAEEARAAQKKKEREQWGRGLVQRREQAARQTELKSMQGEHVARRADDQRMNDALREKVHWDDPAQAFLTRRRGGPRVSRPQYSGPPPPPNRFDIKPGYRWDGVDRSTGFERRYFDKINSRQREQTAFQLSPLATRVLALEGLSPELRTLDFHTLLEPWGDERSYRVKWVNDTTAYIIFHDAGVSKRAYLGLYCAPPPMLRRDYPACLQDASPPPEHGSRLVHTAYASVHPYTGAEAASLIASVTPGSDTRGASGMRGASGAAQAAPETESRAHRRFASGSLPTKPVLDAGKWTTGATPAELGNDSHADVAVPAARTTAMPAAAQTTWRGKGHAGPFMPPERGAPGGMQRSAS